MLIRSPKLRNIIVSVVAKNLFSTADVDDCGGSANMDRSKSTSDRG